ncbi:Callose synthase [Parasponia andersonii]|uniref:Callose synthase n=1 Tax=Parasponia andersonii TaxID=3476 RepID=A0A2P5CFE0_PARAD|nr:Callose synthase [Parasponia andersonii]
MAVRIKVAIVLQRTSNVILKFGWHILIDEVEETEVGGNGNAQNVYYSVLVKAVDNLDQEIHQIKLSGSAMMGEGKPENQNHAIIVKFEASICQYHAEQLLGRSFQDAYLFVLEEFNEGHGVHPPNILGVLKHIFTGRCIILARKDFGSHACCTSVLRLRLCKIKKLAS